jgi:hypothetical protein
VIFRRASWAPLVLLPQTRRLMASTLSLSNLTRRSTIRSTISSMFPRQTALPDENVSWVTHVEGEPEGIKVLDIPVSIPGV